MSTRTERRTGRVGTAGPAGPARAAAMAAAGAMAAAALAAPAVGAGGLSAQEAGGWLPWTGCWLEADAPAGAPMTCVLPGSDGALFLTVADAGVVERSRVRTDGVERPVEEGGCVGVQSAERSRDGHRVFTRARLACEGETERATRGLMAMVSPDRWVRIRALTVGQGSTSLVVAYRPAPASRVEAARSAVPELAGLEGRGMAMETARMAAAARPSVDDVIEASARTDGEAVRAWLVEQGSPPRLDADRLVRLADAGVDEAVIDVLVALAYPDRFQVAREPARMDRDGRDRDWRRARRYYPGLYGSPYFYDPYFFGYYGYSPYGWSRWDRYGYGHGGTVVVVRPTVDGGGRAVKGGGYTRGSSGSGTADRGIRPATTSRGTADRGSTSSGSKGKAKPRGSGGGSGGGSSGGG